jgi:hypothetical protein
MVYFVESFFHNLWILIIIQSVIIVNIIDISISCDGTYSVFLSAPISISLLSVCLNCILYIFLTSSVYFDLGLHNGHLFTVFIFKLWVKSSYCPTGCRNCASAFSWTLAITIWVHWTGICWGIGTFCSIWTWRAILGFVIVRTSGWSAHCCQQSRKSSTIGSTVWSKYTGYRRSLQKTTVLLDS